MSLTSYRAAPSRATNANQKEHGAMRRKADWPSRLVGVVSVAEATENDSVNGFFNSLFARLLQSLATSYSSVT